MQWLLHTGLHVVLFHKLVAGLKSYKQYASLQCSRVIQSPPKRPGQEGVFQALLSAQNPKTGSPLFTQAELVSESSLLIIAGSGEKMKLFYFCMPPLPLYHAPSNNLATSLGSRIFFSCSLIPFNWNLVDSFPHRYNIYKSRCISVLPLAQP